MKVTVTKIELLSILTEHFRHPVTECVISKESSRLWSHIECAMTKEVGAVRFSSDKKISAIRSLRALVDNMGLFESKWAIENWKEWIAFVKKNDRVPRITSTEIGHSVTLT